MINATFLLEDLHTGEIYPHQEAVSYDAMAWSITFGQMLLFPQRNAVELECILWFGEDEIFMRGRAAQGGELHWVHGWGGLIPYPPGVEVPPLNGGVVTPVQPLMKVERWFQRARFVDLVDAKFFWTQRPHKDQ